ncbi:LHFPL tetraspan subfamily member 3 protein isoform X1 [Cydia pomonella]|uniref:LHFPL tetraspan subfamily member 3 protein isoform X1 n=2 Tax=Cydia TaxID=82599 RepID=UPI0021395E31|nr:LHFPL tetraspan subfamily member 3 protein isoform X1 [Cydia pomonella]
MGSKIEYVDSSHLYATNYVRNSKAIGVLWAIFTICYAIISVVAFVTPEWIGDLETEYPRKFGLWQVCRTDDALEDCKGRLDDFFSINGLVFKIATALVGIAVAAALFTICTMLLFFFCQSTTVFHICGWLQLLSAACMIAGVCVYPAAWGEPAVQETCGPTADQYNIGRCHIRWAYLLAVIGCLDGIVLAALAFILATRHVRLQPDSHYPPPSLYKGEVNNAYVTDAASVASRKSLALQPVLLVPHARARDLDSYSHYSQRSKHGYANTMHNYQL